MTDIEFEALVQKLFDKHALRLGGDHWSKGELGLDDYYVLVFAKELKDVLEKKTK